MNKVEDRSPRVGGVVNVCKENIIKDGDREHNKYYRQSPRTGHNDASNVETFYHRSLIPTTTKTTIAAITKTPARDIHRFNLRHHLALSYLASSIGPNWRA